MPNFPPEIRTTLKVVHTFRFKATSAGASTITTANVMSLLTYYVGPTTANYSLFSAIRVRKIRMWSSPLIPTGGGSTLKLVFNTPTDGNIGSRPQVYTSSSQGSTVPAKIEAVPSPGSSSAAPQNLISSTTLTDGFSVSLSYGVGTIVDFRIEFYVNNGQAPFVQTLYSPGTPTTGRFYQNYLDTGNLPQPNLAPVGHFPDTF